MYAVLVNAWVADDAFISMRHAQNLVEGAGLTFNPGERVQGFTNPLWTLILALVRLISTNLFVFSFVAAGLGAVAIVWLLRVRTKSIYTATVVLVLLASSKAFVEYTSSGLENTLAHVLLMTLTFLYLGKENLAKGSFWLKHHYFILSLLTALAVFNRFDHALLVLPLWVVETWQLGLKKAWKQALLAFSPLIVWCVFALVYYGFLLPNTYYAKLSAGLPSAWYWERGLHYFRNSLAWDPLTLLLILSIVIWAIAARSRRYVVIVGGIVAYLIYVASIGGDFMSGRHFTAPLAVSIVLGAVLVEGLMNSRMVKGWQVMAGLVPLVLVGWVIAPYNPIIHPLFQETRSPLTSYSGADAIADEALYYCPENCLMNASRHYNNWQRGSFGFIEGIPPRDLPVVMVGGMGMAGYYVPSIRYIDVFALGDPLLARLPYDVTYNQADLRIGHIGRKVPAGYVQTLKTGQNSIVTPCLRDLYNDLQKVVADPIFSGERWRAILRMHAPGKNYLASCTNEQGTVTYQHGWE